MFIDKMTGRTIYSASLERLGDYPNGSSSDWERRERAGGRYMDYEFGSTWRFSEEGNYPGSESDSEDDGSPLKLLATCVNWDSTGRKKFVLHLEETE